MEKLLQNKVAIVTGASRGIGRAIVLKLCNEGAKVAFNYSSDEKSVAETIKLLEEQKCEYLVFKGSVTDVNFVKSMVDEVKKKWQTIDILVNNAGIIKDKPLLMMSEDDWDEVISVNLKGAFYFTKYCISSMIAQKNGAIVLTFLHYQECLVEKHRQTMVQQKLACSDLQNVLPGKLENIM